MAATEITIFKLSAMLPFSNRSEVKPKDHRFKVDCGPGDRPGSDLNNAVLGGELEETPQKTEAFLPGSGDDGNNLVRDVSAVEGDQAEGDINTPGESSSGSLRVRVYSELLGVPLSPLLISLGEIYDHQFNKIEDILSRTSKDLEQ